MKFNGKTFLATLAAINMAATGGFGQESAGQQAPQIDLQVVPANQATAGAAVATMTAADEKKLIGQAPEDALRDPFWPIDYIVPVTDMAIPTPMNVQGEAPPKPSRKWDQAQRSISIKGIIQGGGNKYVASINNQLVAETELVSVMFEGQKYTWEVTSITAKKVLFKPVESSGTEEISAADAGPVMGP
jgi:hypothetical protein